jgi:hypothetical protein
LSTPGWYLDERALLRHCGFEILERDVGGGIYATYVCRPK